MYDEKAKARTIKYLKSKREKLNLNLPLGTKEIWRGIAAEHGMSVTALITKLIEEEEFIMKKRITEKEKEAMVKLLDIAGIESDIETMQRDDSLTINTARNGRDVAWMLTETQNIAVYVDSLQQLTEEEIERELM